MTVIPTLLVGIGEKGRGIVGRTQAALRESFAPLAPAVRAVGIYQPVEALLDEKGVTVPREGQVANLSHNLGADEDLLFPCEEVTTDWFETRRAEFQERCSALTKEWLATRNLQQVQGVQSNACDLLFTASL
ncbi:MAG: hypothetical protein RMK49_15505, partial [Abditibacteriales bacterium]|nr:hypothetical protein [Abditibacteriales bacterium]